MDNLCKDGRPTINDALTVEHHVQRIITQQETNGVRFNQTRASFYCHILKGRKADLYRSIRPYLSLEVIRPYANPVSKPFLKSGAYSISAERWYQEREDLQRVHGPFSRVEFHQPDLSKRQKLIAQLLTVGWIPKNYTDKGSPRLTVEGEPCSSLLEIGSEIGKWIAEWYVCNHRHNQIRGLLKLQRLDGRISARAITIGTPTFRFRHSGVVNIPRSSSYFGRQLRSLFTIENSKTHRMVGFDASGLELRMLAHYINDPDFTKAVTEGKQEDGTDVHTRNQKDAGLDTRDDGKTFIYAFIYGAGDGKIGSIAGKGRVAGKRIKERFLQKNPALEALIKNTQQAAKRGYLMGLDGRKLPIRRDKLTGEYQTHKALNTLCQGAGAVVMKWAMILIDSWVNQYKLDAIKVIDMHDEGQHEVSIRDAHSFGRLAVLAIQTVGQLLNLNVPLDGDYKVGLNWSHTH